MEEAANKKGVRQDVLALVFGLIFIILLLGGMWGWGNAKGWHAASGYTHDEVNTSQSRFLPEPEYCNDTSIHGRSGAGCTSTWYYWKLPPNEVTAGTRAFVWLCYSLHQIFIWGLIYRAQLATTVTNKGKEKKYGTNLRWFNWSMLLINALFHVLHLVQTHITYDATAQDVSISSSQASVIMLVCFILLIEYKDRGLMLMWPNPRSEGRIANALRLHSGPVQLIRKYHGFAFSWASIYTFWYHPMENTWGHTLGFFHTAILLLQGSLVYTEIHLNRYWRLLNECWVIIHATGVAVQTGDPSTSPPRSNLWPLFTFGFGFVFAFTQVFSLPFWRKAPSWTRIFPPVIYFAVVISLSATIVPAPEGKSGLSQMYVLTFIPAQEYLQVLLSWLFLYLFIVIEAKVGIFPTPDGVKAAEDKETGVKQSGAPSVTKQALYLCGVILIYALMILGSYFYQKNVLGINMTVAMVFFVFIFSTGVCVTVLFFKQLIGPNRPLYKPVSRKVFSSESESESQSHDNNSYVSEKM